MPSQSIQISNFSWGGMPLDPPRKSCYAAKLPSATVHATLLVPYWPYHPSDASYGPTLLMRLVNGMQVCYKINNESICT